MTLQTTFPNADDFIFTVNYFGVSFIDSAVTTLLFCTAFPSDRLPGCHQRFDTAGLTAAPKAPNKHVLAALLRPEVTANTGTTEPQMVPESGDV